MGEHQGGLPLFRERERQRRQDPESHFAASAQHIQATDGPILILQDTTEFSFKRAHPEKIGFTKVSTGRKLNDRRHQKHTICGLLMHASLAITPDGLPLGLTAAKFWSRDSFKGTTALKRKINPTRVPIGKQKKYQHHALQIIHAEELSPPDDRPAVFWKLITNLPVENHEDAIHKLGWYARRWTIETFFKTLKTGCRIEDARLTTADRLANDIALCCVVAWRISWLTILRRQAPAGSPEAVFTHPERILLERATQQKRKSAPSDLAFYQPVEKGAYSQILSIGEPNCGKVGIALL